MINNQKTEGRIHSDGFDIIKVWETIQGEGPRIGEPSVFVRFAGCNLQCRLCDTNYTRNRYTLTRHQLVLDIKRKRSKGLVVFTGGEPLRQNLAPLIHDLSDHGFEIQIETNGTFFQADIPWGHITTVCSPKTPRINDKLLPHLSALKYTIEAGKVDRDGLPTSILGMDTRPARPPRGFDPGRIFIQPVDTGHAAGNKRNNDQAIAVCLKFGFRLCLQTHKYVGLE